MARVNKNYRAGYVAIVGRPNMGKSTLLNRLLGMKLAITAPKPKTTRHRLLGVLDTEAGQIGLIDTPGLHLERRPRRIEQTLTETATGAIMDADLVWLVVEAGLWTPEDDRVLQRLISADKPMLLVVNKIDRLSRREQLLPFLKEMADRGPFVDMIPCSGQNGTNLDRLVQVTLDHLPQQPAMYTKDTITDRNLRFFAAELIREQIVRGFHGEMPYACAVEIERFEETPELLRVAAVVWVEREGQKAILIGRAGERLKKVGIQARRRLEELAEVKVYLRIWVKIKPGWADDEGFLRRLAQSEGS